MNPRPIFLLLAISAGVVANASSVSVQGQNLVLAVTVPRGMETVELRVHSSRNRSVSKISDVAPRDPRPQPASASRRQEIYSPVMDVENLPGWEAVAEFGGVGQGDRYCLNGDIDPTLKPLATTVVFPLPIEHWENALYVESKTADLKAFYLHKKFQLGENDSHALRLAIPLLTPDWSGEVRLVDRTGDNDKMFDRFEVTAAVASTAPVGTDNLACLEGVVDFLLRSQNRNPSSPTHGGLYLYYDLDARTFRCPEWMWAYGPTIKVLLEAAEIPEVAAKFGHKRLIAAARAIGEASLRFQITDPAHPAYGLMLCRYDPKVGKPGGYEGLCSPADSNFLMGYGWMPLYQATGDKRFLEAAELLARQCGRILKLDDFVLQDYWLRAAEWDKRTLGESGFIAIGFSELYAATHDEEVRRIGREYMDRMMARFQREDGLWERAYTRTTGGAAKVDATNYATRSEGWGMIGLLASEDMFPDDKIYPTYAAKMADAVIGGQLAEGSWSYRLDQPSDKVGVTAKGTALWSMLLFQLYHKSGDPRHLEAARRALAWCNAHEYRGDDVLARGGLVDCNHASGISYRHWFNMITSYGVAFHGLALLEDLRLSGTATTSP